MKKVFLFAIAVLCYGSSKSQLFEIKFTPELYIGAPKAELINAVVANARAQYETESHLWKWQKEKGFKLKKADVRKKFLDDMEADLRNQLSKSDQWEGYSLYSKTGINLQKYFLSVEALYGRYFTINGFEKFTPSSTPDLPYARVMFTYGKVSQIQFTQPVTTVLNPVKILPFSETLVADIEKELKKVFGPYKKQVSSNLTDWNSDRAIYPRHTFTYTFVGAFCDLSVTFYYTPYGNNSGDRYYYKGTAMTSVSWFVTK